MKTIKYDGIVLCIKLNINIDKFRTKNLLVKYINSINLNNIDFM